jgi:hypothetical protein
MNLYNYSQQFLALVIYCAYHRSFCVPSVGFKTLAQPFEWPSPGGHYLKVWNSPAEQTLHEWNAVTHGHKAIYYETGTPGIY